MEPRARRSRLLTGLGLVGCLGALATACAPERVPDEAATRALEYLESTDDELGVDVLVSMQIYAELSGDAHGDAVVEARLPDIRPSDLARYGGFLAIDKPVLSPRSLEGVPAPVGTPDPRMTLDDSRDAVCPEQMLSCTADASCIDYALLDGWGYVLTHQALWILLASWGGCELPPEIDLDERREEIAARLVAEMRVDPSPGDLFFERLAMLGHLGFASEIEPAWLDALRDAQQPDGCFPVDAVTRCHPHPTGLALWTLGHAARLER